MATKDPNRESLTAEQLHDALSYDPDTGIFRWKHRADRADWWNDRYAGKAAGSMGGTGHININLKTDKKRFYLAHRLAWLYVHGEWPPKGCEIDHADMDPSNNRIANLRLATHAQNLANVRVRKHSRVGLKGVRHMGKNFQAIISVGGRQKCLGTFASPEAAHAAYAKAAKQIHGDFARM